MQADVQPSAGAAGGPVAEAIALRPLRIALLGYGSQPYGGGQGVYLRFLSRALVEAGARTDIRGTGAPGFQSKTALDLAHDRGDATMIKLLSDQAHPAS